MAAAAAKGQGRFPRVVRASRVGFYNGSLVPARGTFTCMSEKDYAPVGTPGGWMEEAPPGSQDEQAIARETAESTRQRAKRGESKGFEQFAPRPETPASPSASSPASTSSSDDDPIGANS